MKQPRGFCTRPLEYRQAAGVAIERCFAYVPERAVRIVREHLREQGSPWAAISSMAGKIGCTAHTLCNGVRQAERNQGPRPGSSSGEHARFKALEREVRAVRQAKVLLRKANAYFAQAQLDRPFKP